MNTIFNKIVLVLAVLFLSTCKDDYLEVQPKFQILGTDLTTLAGLEGLLIGAYSLLDGQGNINSPATSAGNWILGSVCGTEAHVGSYYGDLYNNILKPIEIFKENTSNDAIQEKWSAMYDGIQRCNDILRFMLLTKGLNPQDIDQLSGEARFLRAFYHFEAKKIWNRIPFVDEQVVYTNKSYFVSNDKDSWALIENDLNYAISHLKITSFQDAPGRANRITAMAYLAKAYIFQSKWDKAKPLLDAIISNGYFHLASKFNDNFTVANKNGVETIFSTQSSVNDGSLGYNGNAGDIFFYPWGGPGGCCGFFQPSQYLVNHFKTNQATGLPDLDQFNGMDVTNDQGIESSQPFKPFAGTLDPRIDWTVGRRGIPYLDWGVFPGKDWIRDQNFGGPYISLKGIISQAESANFTDKQAWSVGFNAKVINLFRYSDLLLLAAECEIEIGDLNKAREYVNQIRRRAANPDGFVKKDDGTPAANYFIKEYSETWADKAFARKAVRYERMLELGMEGHRFFDLVRWGIADQEINAYLDKEKTLRTYLKDAFFKKGCNEYFPLPQLEIDLSKNTLGKSELTQNPCY